MLSLVRGRPNLETLIEIDLIWSQMTIYLNNNDLLGIRFVSQSFYRQIFVTLLQRGSKLKKLSEKQTLISLKLNHFHTLTDSQLLSRVMGVRIFLEELYLDSCWNITSQTIIRIARSCLRLRRLSLTRIYSLEDVALSAIGHWLGRQLEWLNLEDCWRVTDLGIRNLQAAPQGSPLVYLNVTRCSQVSADTIARLLIASGGRLKIIHDKADLY